MSQTSSVGRSEFSHYDEDIRVAAIFRQVSFPGYRFILNAVDHDKFGISVTYYEPDVETGHPAEQRGRLWVFPSGQTAGQIVQTCFKAVLTSLEHRAREHFLYRGKPVLQPHLDVDAVWAMLPDRETQRTEIGFQENGS